MDRRNNIDRDEAPQNNDLIDHELLRRLQNGEVNFAAYVNEWANEIDEHTMPMERLIEQDRRNNVEAHQAVVHEAFMELARRAMDAELNALRAEINATRAENDAQRAQIGALRAQLDEARAHDAHLHAPARAAQEPPRRSRRLATRAPASQPLTARQRGRTAAPPHNTPRTPRRPSRASALQPSRHSASRSAARSLARPAQAPGCQETSSSQAGKKRSVSGKPKNN